MKLSQLLEALKPSQYRNLVKGWDKSKYADLFGGKYRIYIPLGEKAKEVKVNPEVESFVKSQGYEIEDYLTGIASKDNGKRKVRIGKLLAKEPELKKKFDNDPSRNSSQSEYIVVISRHPYDIAGMTSGRDWEERSCMNLDTGVNCHYVPLDIKEGTLVAYLIKNTDKNIESPSARVLIKPFVNTDGSGEIAFGVESKVYGNPNSEFQQTVVDWADGVNNSKRLNGVFELNTKLYNDSLDEYGYSKPIIIGTPSEKKQIDLVRKNSKAIQYIKNPSEAVQLEAVKQYAYAIKYIKNPSEAVQLEAVKRIGSVIQYIKNPSEAVQLEAVKQNEYAIQYIKDPSEQVQIEAVKMNGSAIQYFKGPSEQVQIEAVKMNGSAIQFIKDPSEQVQIEAVKQNGYAIQYIKDPSEAVQLEAVKQDGWVIHNIKSPTDAVKKYVKEHK